MCNDLERRMKNEKKETGTALRESPLWLRKPAFLAVNNNCRLKSYDQTDLKRYLTLTFSSQTTIVPGSISTSGDLDSDSSSW